MEKASDDSLKNDCTYECVVGQCTIHEASDASWMMVTRSAVSGGHRIALRGSTMYGESDDGGEGGKQVTSCTTAPTTSADGQPATGSSTDPGWHHPRPSSRRI